MGIKPRLPAERKAPEANPDVNFLKLLRLGRPVVIDRHPAGRWATGTTTMNEVRRFIGRHDGVPMIWKWLRQVHCPAHARPDRPLRWARPTPPRRDRRARVQNPSLSYIAQITQTVFVAQSD
jgi:hypothetical protein